MMSHVSNSKLRASNLHITDLDFAQEVWLAPDEEGSDCDCNRNPARLIVCHSCCCFLINGDTKMYQVVLKSYVLMQSLNASNKRTAASTRLKVVKGNR